MARTTLWRMRNRPAFQKRFEEARTAAFEGAINCLHSSAVVFARTLRDVCTDPKSRDSARATAARSGLDSLFKSKEQFDFETRLRKLAGRPAGEQK